MNKKILFPAIAVILIILAAVIEVECPPFTRHKTALVLQYGFKFLPVFSLCLFGFCAGRLRKVNPRIYPALFLILSLASYYGVSELIVGDYFAYFLPFVDEYRALIAPVFVGSSVIVLVSITLSRYEFLSWYGLVFGSLHLLSAIFCGIIAVAIEGRLLSEMIYSIGCALSYFTLYLYGKGLKRYEVGGTVDRIMKGEWVKNG